MPLLTVLVVMKWPWFTNTLHSSARWRAPKGSLWVNSQGFLVSLTQVWLPAMKAKGLEISGTFSRQVGSISMDLVLTNKALQVMSDFAIQFNRNR